MTQSHPLSHHVARRVDRVRQAKALGRLHAPDPRDNAFPLRAVVAPVPVTTKYWPFMTAALDQGARPQCVAFSWTHFLLSTPITHRPGALGPSLTGFAEALYTRAQTVDEWPGECVDSETECLTDEGWKFGHQLHGGERILTLDIESHALTWKRLQVVHRFASAPYRVWSHKGAAIAVTDNHRWLVTNRNLPGQLYELVSTVDLKSQHAVPRAALASEQPTEATVSDDLVELIAWAITEGHYRGENRRGHGVVITQKTYKDRVGTLMDRLGVAPGFTKTDGCHSWELSGSLALAVRAAAPDRAPTVEWFRQLTQRQLRLFVDTVVRADGFETQQQGRRAIRSITQKSGKILDAILSACVLAGIAVSRARIDRTSLVETWTLRRSRFVELRRLQPSLYLTGPVWCPQTDGGTFVARRRGTIFITGNSYDGTSVRAGAKVLRADGRLVEYRWAFDAKTARDFVLSRGPIVFGSNWYERMFVPDTNGWLVPEGELAGGHAYLLIGFSKARNAFRVLNSWGYRWGQGGRAWLAFDVAQRLIDEDGEACSALEVKPANESTEAPKQ